MWFRGTQYGEKGVCMAWLHENWRGNPALSDSTAGLVTMTRLYGLLGPMKPSAVNV